jgi:hypothetical protein|tara:strand:- start:58 stop:1233 length:1176 start_codon:yes stop_codon:yes gene_type:complete
MATSAIETAKQENGSKVFFESVIEKGREPSDKEMLKIYDGYNSEWKETYRKQTNALKKFLGSNKGYEYSRDTGIMPYIEDLAKKTGGVSVKDRWNPMDIVLVKKNQKKVIMGTLRELTNIDGISKEANLSLLNTYMKEALQEKILIGVSLKAISKTKKNANAELANMSGDKTGRVNIDLVSGSVKCTLTLGKKYNYLFDTGELGFDMQTESGGKIHGQSRNFQYSKARNVIQTDLTPKGKDSGAKLGKVSSIAMDKFLPEVGLKRPPSATKHPHIPKVGQWTENDKRYWIKLFNKLKTSNVIDFGEIAVYESNIKIGTSFEEILENAIIYETRDMDRSSAGRFSSKLIAMEWANCWVEISKKKKLKEWCRVLYYGAKKEFGSSNGPFLKIY